MKPKSRSSTRPRLRSRRRAPAASSVRAEADLDSDRRWYSATSATVRAGADGAKAAIRRGPELLPLRLPATDRQRRPRLVRTPRSQLPSVREEEGKQLHAISR